MTLSIELAMLFLHAGFGVYYAADESSEGWLAKSAIKEVTGHQVFSTGQTPKWAEKVKVFDAGIIISPSVSLQQNLIENHRGCELSKLILDSCRRISIIQSLQFVPENLSALLCPLSIDFKILPESSNKYLIFYQSVFSDYMNYFYRHKRFNSFGYYIDYILPGVSDRDNNWPDWLVRLDRTLAETGMKKQVAQPDLYLRIDTFGSAESPESLKDNKNSQMIENASVVVDFLNNISSRDYFAHLITDKHIFACLKPLGLTVYSNKGDRVIPNVSFQGWYPRFCRLLLSMLPGFRYD